MQPKNLYDYYANKGQTLPSIAERRGVATQAGINNYAGTASQNKQLLTYLTNGSVPQGTAATATATRTQPQTTIGGSLFRPNSMGQLQNFGVSPITPEGDISLGGVQEVEPVAFGDAGAAPTLDTTGFASLTDYLGGVDTTSEETRLTGEREKIESDIATIEARISGRVDAREGALEDANVFEDMRTLTEMRAKLAELNDRQDIEIPLEARAELRGRGATTTEYEQTTTPRLENNLLKTIAQTRQVEALNSLVQTNLSIVNDRFNQEIARDEFLYEQKQKQLETIESAYSDILTSQQTAALEERKFQNELYLIDATANADLRKELLTKAIERGISGAELTELQNMTPEELAAWDSQYTTTATNYLGMPLEQAQFLPKEEFDLWERINEKADADEAQAYAIATGTKRIIDEVDYLLDNKVGLARNVGGNPFAREFGMLPDITGKTKNWRTAAKKLLAGETFNKLAEITESSTLGAISEGEIKLVQAAATSLNQIDETGRFDMTEGEFRKQLNIIKAAQMKIFIREQVGFDKYMDMGLREVSDIEELGLIYDAAVDLSQDNTDYAATELQSKGVPPPSQVPEALSLLREEEGFRANAYQDTTGTWTIGFGNTMINGRPVQPSDRLTGTQAEQLLRQEADRHSNFRNFVQRPLTPKQIAALTSFEYNLGSNIWQDQTAQRILTAVNQDNMQLAGALMQQFRNAYNPNTGRTEVNSVLANRRAREAQLLFA